jgi:hypothetical protein
LRSGSSVAETSERSAVGSFEHVGSIRYASSNSSLKQRGEKARSFRASVMRAYAQSGNPGADQEGIMSISAECHQLVGGTECRSATRYLLSRRVDPTAMTLEGMLEGWSRIERMTACDEHGAAYTGDGWAFTYDIDPPSSSGTELNNVTS